MSFEKAGSGESGDCGAGAERGAEERVGGTKIAEL